MQNFLLLNLVQNGKTQIIVMNNADVRGYIPKVFAFENMSP